MVFRERNNTTNSRTTTIVHLFQRPNQMEMKKPVEMWQMVIGLITFGIGLATIAVNTSNRLTDQEARIRTLENSIEKVLHRFDRIEEKQDQHNEKTNQILILLQNKEDRK